MKTDLFDIGRELRSGRTAEEIVAAFGAENLRALLIDSIRAHGLPRSESALRLIDTVDPRMRLLASPPPYFGIVAHGEALNAAFAELGAEDDAGKVAAAFRRVAVARGIDPEQFAAHALRSWTKPV